MPLDEKIDIAASMKEPKTMLNPIQEAEKSETGSLVKPHEPERAQWTTGQDSDSHRQSNPKSSKDSVTTPFSTSSGKKAQPKQARGTSKNKQFEAGQVLRSVHSSGQGSLGLQI